MVLGSRLSYTDNQKLSRRHIAPNPASLSSYEPHATVVSHHKRQTDPVSASGSHHADQSAAVLASSPVTTHRLLK